LITCNAFSARASNRLRVKAKATIDGRLRQDRDTIIYR